MTNLDLNRIGYSSRVNSRQVWAWTQYRTTDDIWIVRNSYNNFNFHSSWNYEGTNYSLGGNFNTWVEFTNRWGLGGGATIQAEKYSDRETRGNGDWQWNEHPTYSWWFDLESDESKMFSFSWNPGGGTDRGGYWWANYLGVEYRPRSNMEFAVGANYTRNRNCLYWVENVEDSSLFARMDRDQISLRASASVMFNRNLSCQLSVKVNNCALRRRWYARLIGWLTGS